MNKIVVVDDDRFSLHYISKILEKDYEVVACNRGSMLFEYLKEDWADLILLDYHMPEKDGMEILMELKTNRHVATIPVIMLTGEQDVTVEIACFQNGAEDFITKPYSPEVVISRISRVLELNKLQNDLQQRLEEKTLQMENLMLQAITTVANTVDAKDDYTEEHSVHVAENGLLLAKELGWDDEDLYDIYYAGLLHDIGKISVPDNILLKPSRLDDEEWKVMKGHTTSGADILKDIHVVKMARTVALHHHERFDGTGYPMGLAGEDIPLEARIIALTEAYDAMATDRVYRDHLCKEEIIREFEKGKGTQFDPELTDMFIKMIQEGRLEAKKDLQMLSDEVGISPAEESHQLLFRVMQANAKAVKREAMRDPLTGSYNRSYAEKQINSYLRKNRQGVCFMLDMDNFKQVNDRFGHLAGDDALKNLANMLKRVVKDKGIVCRMGGDEFLLFFYETMNEEELRNMAECIMQEYEGVKREDSNVEVTSLSIGIAWMPQDGSSYKELYDAADKALYLSKRTGKNRYSFNNGANTTELEK